MKKNLVRIMLAALAIGTPSSAMAIDQPGVGVVVFSGIDSAGAHYLADSFLSSSTAPGVVTDATEFKCDATATPDAASTGIDVCKVQTRTRACSTCAWSGWSTVATALNTPSNSPGPFHAVVGAVTGVTPTGPNREYRGCIASKATYLESILGPDTLVLAERCGGVFISS